MWYKCPLPFILSWIPFFVTECGKLKIKVVQYPVMTCRVYNSIKYLKFEAQDTKTA